MKVAIEEGEVDLLGKHTLSTLDLRDASLSPEYFYASLPLCVIDSVFSINAKYAPESRGSAVKNWCVNQKWEKYRPLNTPPRAVNESQTIDAFIDLMENLKGGDFELLAGEKGFNNRQRTSTRKGDLKAKAVYNFAKVLQEEGINTLGDTLTIRDVDGLEKKIRAIKGQGQGITFKYFLMLAGDESFVKADRMLCRFVSDALGLPKDKLLTPEKTEALVIAVYDEKLKEKFPKLTLRTLDYSIWCYQRGQ